MMSVVFRFGYIYFFKKILNIIVIDNCKSHVGLHAKFVYMSTASKGQ